MKSWPVTLWSVACALLSLPAVPVWGAETASPTILYWCPDRVGAEIQLKPGPGCQRVLEESKASPKSTDKARQKPEVKLDNIGTSVGTFMRDYKQFLACCAADPQATKEAELLEERATDILEQMHLLPPLFLMGKARGLIVPVAEARARLRTLEKRQDQLGKAMEKRDRLDYLGEYESAGRENKKIQRETEVLEKEFRPTKQPDRAPTGQEVGDSSLNNRAATGGKIGNSTLNRGAAIGAEVGNSSLNQGSSFGPEVGNSSLNNTATVDMDIGKTSDTNAAEASAGTDPKELGKGLNSNLNEQSSTGPSVGDSSLNRR